MPIEDGEDELPDAEVTPLRAIIASEKAITTQIVSVAYRATMMFVATISSTMNAAATATYIVRAQRQQQRFISKPLKTHAPPKQLAVTPST